MARTDNYRKLFLHKNVEVLFKDGQIKRGFLNIVDEPDDEYTDYYFVMTTNKDSFTFEGDEVRAIKVIS